MSGKNYGKFDAPTEKRDVRMKGRAYVNKRTQCSHESIDEASSLIAAT